MRKKNTDYGPDKTRNPTVLHEYRKMRNKVKNEVHKIRQFKQSQLLDSQKVIQNTFGNISNLNQVGI